MSTENLEVVLLAAGKGTRMKSELPKVLHKLCGLSLLERSLRAISGLSPKKIVLVLGHKIELVEEELKNLNFSNIEVAEQKEQRGTGDAVRVALEKVSDAAKVLILPADVPLIKTKTLNPLLEKDADLSLLSFYTDTPSGFGRILRNEKLQN